MLLRPSVIIFGLNEIEKCKYKDPDQIDKVPIQPYFFHHFIMSSFFIGSYNHIQKYDEVDDDPRKNVETMKAGYKKEKISKESVSVFVMDKVGPFHYTNGIFYFIQGIVS